MAATVEKIEKEPDPTDLDLKAWFASMGGGGTDIEVVVSRVQPPSWKLPNGRVVPIAGKIPGAVHMEMIDEEFIEQSYGGGLYKLQIKKRAPDGRMQHWRGKTVKIAGDPIVDLSLLAANAYQPDDGHAAVPAVVRAEPAGEAPTLSMHALDTMKEVVDDLRADRGRSNGSGGMDLALFETMMAPLRMQLEQNQATLRDFQKTLSDKDRQIMELLARRPDTSTQDTLIGQMWGSESGRIVAIQTQHASELGQVRASYEARESQLAKQHERDLKNKEEDQKRLLDTIQRSHDSVVKNLEAVHAIQIKVLEGRIDDLKSSLSENRSKVAALESIKQQSLVDKAKEIKEFKEALSDGDDDRDEKPTGLWGTLQSVAEGLIENPEVIGQFIGARGGPPPGPPLGGEQPGPRIARLPDGRVVRVGAPPRQVVAQAPVPPVVSVAPAAPAPAIAGAAPVEGAAPPAAAEPPAPPVRPPAPHELALAVGFLENACKSGQDPAVVAASARSLVPTDVLVYLEKVGVDELLNKVTTLDQGSPLRTVQGRNFVRKVAKTLLTGSPE